MVQFDELRLALEELWPDIKDLSEALGMGAIKSEIEQLERRAAEPGFWDDMENSQKILQKTGSLKNKVEQYDRLVASYEDTHALIELANEEEDLSLLDEATAEYEKVKSSLEEQRLRTGQKCFIECITVGQNATALRLKLLTILTVMKQA